jgi:hypothetical protein
MEESRARRGARLVELHDGPEILVLPNPVADLNELIAPRRP